MDGMMIYQILNLALNGTQKSSLPHWNSLLLSTQPSAREDFQAALDTLIPTASSLSSQTALKTALKAKSPGRAKCQSTKYKHSTKKAKKVRVDANLKSDMEPDERVSFGSEEETCPAASDEEEEWEIERLVTRRPTKSGKFIYQARWKNWGPQWDEWKTANDLQNAQGLVDEYEARLAKWETAAESRSDSEGYESSAILKSNRNVEATRGPAESSNPGVNIMPEVLRVTGSSVDNPILI